MSLVAHTVSATLGPRGKLVLMDSHLGTPEVATSHIDRGFDAPFFGNDGLAIASELLIADPLVNQGIRLAQIAGWNTKRTVGDGSTTAILLTDVLVREGIRLTEAGHEPQALERGILDAVSQVRKYIRRMARPLANWPGDVERVAMHAAGGDAEIGQAVALAIAEVGADAVQVERGAREGVEVDVRGGLQLPRGAVSPYLLADRERLEQVLRDCLVLLVDDRLRSSRDLVPLVGHVARSRCQLLIIANDFDPDVLALLTVNKLQHRLDAVAVQAPGHGASRSRLLEDIALLTGAEVVGNATSARLGHLDLARLGTASEVRVTRDRTTIVAEGGSHPERLDARLTELTNAVDEADSLHARDEVARRRAELLGRRFAVVRVAGATDPETYERAHRADDALAAALAALQNGVVVGGGVTLLRAGAALTSGHLRAGEAAGVRMVRRSLEEPLRALARSVGEEEAVVVAQALAASEDVGFDVTRRCFDDLRRAGIVDAARVPLTALESASFIARRVLLTEGIVAQPLSGGRLREMEGGPANLPMP